MFSLRVAAIGAAVASAQFVPAPAPVLLTTTQSAVLPTLPTPFEGVLTNQGAVIVKGPIIPGYVGLEGPAEVQTNVPAGTYTAELPETAFNELTGTVITGTITGSAAEGDTGVTFTLNLSGFPDVAEYGPFGYHIHDSLVPEDGNCTDTLAHWDVTNRGEYFPCDKAAFETCQTGDLSGKHGTITAENFVTTYTDEFITTDPSSPYFFGSKSIVFHTSNTTRLTCANFQLASVAGNGTTGGNATVGGGYGNGTIAGSPQPPIQTGTAAKVVAGSAVLGFAGVVALLF